MKTVLVVQRDSEFADEFADWLTRAGYRVRVCTGPHAPAYGCWSMKFRDCPLWGQADLVLYDPWLQMGPRTYGSGGIIETERSRHPDMPVLIWGSGAAIPKDIATMELPGELEILPLDITPRALVEAVEHMIGTAREP